MRNRRRQFDMAHTLATDLLQRYFNTTFFADNAAILHALIFAAQAFVVFDRAKDTRAEQTVAFWFERTVVDGLGFLISPNDHDRIRSGDARETLISSNVFGRLDGVKRVVCQFLVHLKSLDKSRKAEGVRFSCFRKRVRGDYENPARASLVFLRIQEFHVQAKTAYLFHKYVERFRHAGLEVVFAFDDAFIDLGPSGNVIRFHGQHLLQGVCSAVSFQSPDLHLTEALTTELRFTAQWLLGDQRVWTS